MSVPEPGHIPGTFPWTDLSKFAAQTDPDRDLSRNVLAKIAFEEMEKVDHRIATMDLVGIGPYYWVTDDIGHLHLARDTAPVADVRALGLAEVERLYEEAKRQEKDQ